MMSLRFDLIRGIAFISLVGLAISHDPNLVTQSQLRKPFLSINNIPFSTRAYWIQQANAALPSPCPFAAFGTVIVNHSSPGLGELVCAGANENAQKGNPTLHGEIVTINNCSAILTDPSGPYNLSASEALAAFSGLSLYTNAESCPMCASAIRWAGFREYIYGTSIETLVALGWSQIRISSQTVFEESWDLSTQTKLIGDVLINETDPYFAWQFDPFAPCPVGCTRNGGMCGPADS
ncbi:cytidine deaminase-like protein [Aulographum hederae CBS 113979]|uniref:Cytidine deaminase-like protein n=1 Tax=Aulographum hederae CBS 113979 TaxID=1176131 RepID=A0A6G1H7F7_9PEZI|nr:cytidine deaminase-like protein [Aulographum hederae CBS 113979]